MNTPILRKYGEAATIDFHLYNPDGVNFNVNAVHASGDTTIMIDEAAETNTANGFVDEGSGYSISLTASEMQGARIKLYIADQGTKEWLDTSIVIETYGHASAQHAFDLDTSSTPQTGDAYAAVGLLNDIAVAEIEASPVLAKDSTVINQSQKLMSVIESQRGAHTGITNVFYWDPANGNDTNDGLTPATAKLTYDFTDVNGGIHGLLTDSNHDIVIIYPSATGATVITEYIEIDKRFTFLRGPGRDAFINYGLSTSCAIKLSAEGIELSGVRVNTTAGNTDAISITGDFAHIHDIWVDSCRGDAIFIDNANNCKIDEFVIQDAASGGSGHAIRIDGSVTGAIRNFISDGKIIDNNGDGIRITGSGCVNNMIFGRLFIHGNNGYGINELNGADNSIIVGPSISISNNISGDISLIGVNSAALNVSQYATSIEAAIINTLAQKSANAAYGTYKVDVPNNQLVLYDESLVEVARWDLYPDYVNPSERNKV